MWDTDPRWCDLTCLVPKQEDRKRQMASAFDSVSTVWNCELLNYAQISEPVPRMSVWWLPHEAALPSGLLNGLIGCGIVGSLLNIRLEVKDKDVHALSTDAEHCHSKLRNTAKEVKDWGEHKFKTQEENMRPDNMPIKGIKRERFKLRSPP